MKLAHLLAPTLFAVVTLTAHAEPQTIAYPTVDETSFVLQAPEGWELSPADEEGGYFHLEAPSGATLSFRTLEGNEDALQEAIKEMIADIKERYDDAEIGEAEDWNPHGLEGFYATATAKEKDGTPVRIGMAWCALKDGKIAEVWFVSDLSDEDGMNAASAIVNSLAPPQD